MKGLVLFILLNFISVPNCAQIADSIPSEPITHYIVPSVLFGYGIVAIHDKNVKSWDTTIKNKLKGSHQIGIDDYMVFAPALSVYALNFAGVKGKSTFVDYSFKASIANLINGAVVYTIKNSTHILRPDGSKSNSFPSGHTSTAFVGAELLHQEYGSKSIWYSIAGYSVASATGYMRMYNNRHWFSDVVAGAGLGILSTKITYWLYPKVKKLFKRNKKDIGLIVTPTISGIGLVYPLR